MNNSQLQKYAPIILRLGLAFVFLWFGASQVSSPTMWTALIPGWLTGMGVGALTAVYGNGIFEIIFGILIALNIWTRWAAILLFLHMIFIIIDVGFNAVGVRDIGLALSTLALACWGSARPLPEQDIVHAPVQGNN